MTVGEVGSLRVAVVVLGDIARSPRMRHHAMALASAGATVELIGYVESEPPAELVQHPRIRIHEVASHRLQESERSSPLRYLRSAMVRALKIAWSLFRILERLSSVDLILTQNPPIVPTGVIALVIGRLEGARVVLDWHNLSHSMLALRVGCEHPAVELLRSWEGRFAQMMNGHLCVSRAMAKTLRRSWGIDAEVLYDRPPKGIESMRGAARDELLERVWRMADGRNCPLIVTATSWTDDEDLDMLVDSARDLDRRLKSCHEPHRILFVASGDGPNRQRFERRVAGCDLERVAILTGWLSQQDYESMLGSADLGVSFHRSASGLDLPMKIADMRGAGLPVAALDYGPVLREILDPGVDGLLFSDAADLAGIIERLFLHGSSGSSELTRLGNAVRDRFDTTWMDGWTREALPVIEALTD